MSRDSIERLVKAADRGADSPGVLPHDLAARVRRRAKRRRVRRLALGTTTLVTAGILAVWAVASRPSVDDAGVTGTVPKTDTTTTETIAANDSTIATEAELARLAEEADFLASLARRMIEDIRREKVLARARLEFSRPDPLELVRAEVDKAALRILFRADRLRQEKGDEAAAVATYKHVIRLFPKTTSASQARQRLDNPMPPNGESI